MCVFCLQVFRSKDYNALLYAFGQLFNKVEATKPQVGRPVPSRACLVCHAWQADPQAPQCDCGLGFRI